MLFGPFVHRTVLEPFDWTKLGRVFILNRHDPEDRVQTLRLTDVQSVKQETGRDRTGLGTGDRLACDWLLGNANPGYTDERSSLPARKGSDVPTPEDTGVHVGPLRSRLPSVKGLPPSPNFLLTTRQIFTTESVPD